MVVVPVEDILTHDILFIIALFTDKFVIEQFDIYTKFEVSPI
jgi:hypothetical protein